VDRIVGPGNVTVIGHVFGSRERASIARGRTNPRKVRAPFHSALMARAAERGIASRVRFLGFRSDVPALLAAADIVLLTSAHEALPLAIIEAMLARVAIVSTPWDGASMLLGDGRRGHIAASHAPEAIAHTLRDVIEHRDVAVARVEDAYAYAREEFAVEVQVRRHVELYRKILLRSTSVPPSESL